MIWLNWFNCVSFDFPPQKCGGFFCTYCLKLCAGEEKHEQLHILFGTDITSVGDAKQISNPDLAGRQVINPLTNYSQNKFGW